MPVRLGIERRRDSRESCGDEMTDVFISYGRNDWYRAGKLARILEAEGLSVWWDHKIPLIQKALGRASCIIVLWSTTSVVSNWVKDEAWIGLSRRALVPILVDDVPIPLGFGRIQTANLVDWTGEGSHPELVRVRESIRRLLRREGQNDSSSEHRPATTRARARVRPPGGARSRTKPCRSLKVPSQAVVRQRRLSAARSRPRERRWPAFAVFSLLMGLVAFGIAGYQFRLEGLPAVVVEFLGRIEDMLRSLPGLLLALP